MLSFHFYFSFDIGKHACCNPTILVGFPSLTIVFCLSCSHTVHNINKRMNQSVFLLHHLPTESSGCHQVSPTAWYSILRGRPQLLTYLQVYKSYTFGYPSPSPQCLNEYIWYPNQGSRAVQYLLVPSKRSSTCTIFFS